ncbi:fimbria/pilus periplasmic chaperone [Salmonella enterica]|uniref:Fimbrial chaperone protein StdC n=1 Tax=Salmonella diarizonae TaxID=59204 RepID=A0A5Y1YGD5_SALDZ|nr:fimbrial chaperone protein StdC [Salmonella enterica]EBS3849481.1 fimbrial chaperone protein StdC [Salmonella enterica subsp. enterica serovar Java]EBX2707429.1 fimbrial chaperone protein StdC [Salmonella enterica subsp. enterica serovar Bredeney]ECB2072279.1 fimbrial chaperone protein StdC [Salmonella enterica subsp. enterica serovar Benin]ECC3917596.1 fimbrial chaperone protein StdC [Salmonella enterica subsp. diarizonae]EDX3987483.1 fimbria/pilus periplasmic chaperone [Salmonella enteric
MNIRPVTTLISALLLWVPVTHAAINVDRTRIIMDSRVKSLSIELSNESTTLPYLAQAWVENAQGKRSNQIIALPPLQRIDAGQKSQVRIMQVKGSGIEHLPQDRETLFYFKVQEIPPRPEDTGVNILQLAQQSRLKLFYRPTAISKPFGDTSERRLVVLTHGGHVTLKNPTPYYISVIWMGLTAVRSLKGFSQDTMVPPYSDLPLNAILPADADGLLVGYIDDYGGMKLNHYRCQSGQCTIQNNTNG